MFHNNTAGKIAKAKSVAISIAEKKKLMSLLSCRLHVPSASPQRVSMGWQMLATPDMKMMAAEILANMIPPMVHVITGRESEMRNSVTAMLHLTVAAAEE